MHFDARAAIKAQAKCGYPIGKPVCRWMGAAALFGPPPFQLPAPSLTAAVAQLWLVSALIVAGVVIGGLILAALSLSFDQREEHAEEDQ